MLLAPSGRSKADMVTARDVVLVRPDPVSRPVEWRISKALVAYEAALAAMEARAAAIGGGLAPELVWLLEHSPLYTAGTSAKEEELIAPRFPVHSAGRGGQFTYHGPGQRVVYLMLDLKRRGPDVRRFVATLEEWIIRTLAKFNVAGERRKDRIGVWVRRPEKGVGHEDQIAAIGIRIKRSVSMLAPRCSKPSAAPQSARRRTRQAPLASPRAPRRCRRVRRGARGGRP